MPFDAPKKVNLPNLQDLMKSNNSNAKFEKQFKTEKVARMKAIGNW